MNPPVVIDAIIATLDETFHLDKIEVCDGGFLVAAPPPKSISLFGSTEGDEEWAALGKGQNETRLRYSLGLQATVFVDGLGRSSLKKARDSSWEIYARARAAIQAMTPGEDLPESVEQAISVTMSDLTPGFTSKSRVFDVSGYVRVIERGPR